MERVPGVTAFVIVKDEYLNIGLCLASLFNQVDHVLLIDDGSAGLELLKPQYQYWHDVFMANGDGFTLVQSPCLGFHHLHFPTVAQKVTTEWMFGLDGDEILKTTPYTRLRDLIKTVPETTSSIGCTLYEYEDQEFERDYPKYRLLRCNAGAFNVVAHGEFKVTSGDRVLVEDFWIDHMRTKREKAEDAVRYKAEAILQYRNATTPETKKHWADHYCAQALYYGWPITEVENA